MYLVDGPRVGHGFVVLDDGDGLSGQDGLVDAERGGVDLDDPEVGGHLVTDGDLDNVAGNHLHSLDLLDTLLVGTDDLDRKIENEMDRFVLR